MANRLARLTALWVLLPMILSVGCAALLRFGSSDAEQIELIRQVERERLRSLVVADVATARRLHADDFELITPTGAALTKAEYLNQVDSGQVDYRAWEAGEIVVRLYGNTAMIRYRDVTFDVDSRGRAVHRGPMFHTNLYERRGEQWQIVWAQASGQITPPRP